jgi:cytochrome c553
MIRTQHNFVTYLAASLFTASLFVAATVQAGESPDEVKQRIGSGSPVKGKTRSELCQGCHGEKGVSREALIPNLAGQYGNYIAKQLRNFQTGARTHQIMNAMAQTVNDDELSDIAAYFSSQNKMQGSGKGSNPVAVGLFTKGDAKRGIPPCMSCHGANGKGQSPKVSTYPVIGGQKKEYLVAQLTHWRSGERSNSPDGVMNKVAKSLTDAEIKSLTEYISGL